MSESSQQGRVSAARGVLLGVDHGTKIIGLAVCDASWIVARPLALLRRKSRAEDFAQIRALVAKHQAVGVVVGLPLTPPHFVGVSQAETVRRWSTRLAAALRVPVYLWDETLSTFEARERAAEAGVVRPEARIDAQAAAVILQSFIEAHRAGAALPSPVKHRPSSVEQHDDHS